MRRERVLSWYGKKIHRGPSALSSLSHRSIQLEKKEGEAKASCAWRQGMSGGETYKGGADGGGGRAKGKTKAGRHSRTPSETWPLERERRKK